MEVKVTVQDLREEPAQKNRAVIYARYSSDRQKEASIEQQTRECMDYVNRMGYELIKIYADSAKSASKDLGKRSEFLKLIEDSAGGDFDVVVAYALDRISREEHGGFYEYEKTLQQNGVRIEYATQVFNEEYGGGISKAVHVEMASEYVVHLRKNVVRGMRDNAMHGGYNGGKSLPVGIRVYEDGKRKYFAPDENVRPYILAAFEQYVAGATTREICDELNEHGVRTSAGKPLTTNSVNRMLANPIYKGTKVTVFDNKVEHKIYTAENACEAIVSEDLWDRVQAERVKRLHLGATERTRATYELQGKLFCGVCGTRMIADQGKGRNGTVHRYYACQSKKSRRKGDPARCVKQNVPKEAVEAAVLEIISDFIWDDELIQAYIEAAETADKTVTVNPRVAELEKLLRNHKERKARADDAYLDTGDADWLARSKEEKAVIQKYENELKAINSLTARSKNAQDFAEEIRQLRDLWLELQATPEGRRRIVQLFVERIEVSDPMPDDPGKYKLKLTIKTDPDVNDFTLLETSVDLPVRDRGDNVHQEKSTAKAVLFSMMCSAARNMMCPSDMMYASQMMCASRMKRNTSHHCERSEQHHFGAKRRYIIRRFAPTTLETAVTRQGGCCFFAEKGFEGEAVQSNSPVDCCDRRRKSPSQTSARCSLGALRIACVCSPHRLAASATGGASAIRPQARESNPFRSTRKKALRKQCFFQ
ncbi:MAG: recombinase family protein [Clostridia bacterium]|nr:recombinase family protein [Clostridia bacterium]